MTQWLKEIFKKLVLNVYLVWTIISQEQWHIFFSFLVQSTISYLNSIYAKLQVSSSIGSMSWYISGREFIDRPRIYYTASCVVSQTNKNREQIILCTVQRHVWRASVKCLAENFKVSTWFDHATGFVSCFVTKFVWIQFSSVDCGIRLR